MSVSSQIRQAGVRHTEVAAASFSDANNFDKYPLSKKSEQILDDVNIQFEPMRKSDTSYVCEDWLLAQIHIWPMID